MFSFLLGALLAWIIYLACNTRKLTGFQGLFGSRFWLLTIPAAILSWVCIPLYGPGIAMAILCLSFMWMCLHSSRGQRWDGSWYRRWYY